jgi:hypothetical protein
LEALDLVARTVGVLKGHASCKISARKNKKRAPGDPWGRKQKNEKPHAEQTAKYITHKGSNAFPEKAATAEHHWQIDFGRGSGEAISCRSALQDFGKKNRRSRKRAFQGARTLQNGSKTYPRELSEGLFEVRGGLGETEEIRKVAPTNEKPQKQKKTRVVLAFFFASAKKD